MTTQLEHSIRIKIADFVGNQLSLEALHDWLAPVVWEIEQKNDPEAKELVYSAELAIAEYSAGHLLEGDLRSVLKSFVSHATKATASRHKWIRIGQPISPFVGDRRCEVVFS